MQVERTEVTNTNVESSRLQRAQNQFEFQQTRLSETFGKPFTDRFVLLRKNLFKGFTDVAGEDVHGLMEKGQVLSDARAHVHNEFLPSNEAAAVALPKYIKLIDSLFEEIKSLPEAKTKIETAFRFLAVLFVGGVLIHPAKDGNGQTFKMLVQSYLHDLLPESRHKWIPIKYASGDEVVKRDMTVQFMGGRLLPESEDLIGGSVEHIPRVGAAAALINGLEKLAGLQLKLVSSGALEPAAYIAAMNKGVEQIIQTVAEEIGEKHFARREVETYREFGVGRFKIKIPKTYVQRRETFDKAVREQFGKLGYPTEMINATMNNGSGDQIDRASYAVRQLLATEEGLAFISKYVLTGQAETGGATPFQERLFGKAARAFDKLTLRIQEVLESEEEHQQRHLEKTENAKT